MLLSEWLEVRPSSIAGAGLGLFTTVDIAAGVCVLEYTGVRRAAIEDCVSHGAHAYCFQLNAHTCIDATCKVAGGKGRYVNDAHGTERGVNLKWATVKHASRDCRLEKAFMTSLRYIERGSELFISYGDDYWSFRAQSE